MKRRPIMAFANYENGVHGPFTDLGQRAERMDNPLIRRVLDRAETTSPWCHRRSVLGAGLRCEGCGADW
jgi:hypothetical protein